MFRYILDFLDANLIIFKHQFGFRENYSTQQAIISLVKKITESLDSGDMVIGVLIDLRKAFDTISHDIVLKKMHLYKIRDNASFLTGRSQYVMYDGMLSATMSIKCGVPQGSNLGPQLCIRTMSDIGKISDFLYTILNADDTCALLNEK